MSPGLSLAQTTNIQTPSTNSTTAPAPTIVKPLPINTGAAATPASTTVAPAPIPPTNTNSTDTTAAKKCGVNTFTVNNECGFGAFKNAYIQCYDGYEEKLGGESSCKSSEVWQKYGQEICANRCSTGYMPKPMPTPVPAPQPTEISKPILLAKPIAVCVIPDSLMKEYNALILALQKTEQADNKEATETITQKIIALKQRIAESQKECGEQPSSGVISAPSVVGGSAPAPVATVNRCAEVSQWENKIVYYKKLSSLSDEELKKENGFSKTEIERILAELAAGIEKVKAQCENQKTMEVKPTKVLRQNVVEPVKPVAVESGQEIDTYYKAKIEKITASENTEEQIVKLKALRNEIDELVTNLIKSRKEIEASEFKNLVEEVRVSKGEIKADNVSVETTGKKILVDVGGKSISVEPTAAQVLIKDKNLEVTATEVSIKGEVLKVGNIEVKLAASAVAEKLNIAPKSVELKEQDEKAIYEMKVPERRRLFGFIPLTISNTITANAENGDVMGERHPWYSFLTTK
ncbi:MAG: hypothetical protein Q8N87_03795 [bacterium]|nr:hypothetical protein [bacterium]